METKAMLELSIPGLRAYQIRHLVFDFNGTLAVDGILIPGITKRIITLAQQLQTHILTSDTHGTVTSQMAGLPVNITILTSKNHTQQKAEFVEKLGADETIAIGNGSNDAAMLAKAAIGIALIQQEGASAVTISSADLVFTDVFDAVDALIHPQRLVASLRK